MVLNLHRVKKKSWEVGENRREMGRLFLVTTGRQDGDVAVRVGDIDW